MHCLSSELIASEPASAECDLGSSSFQQGEITNRVMCGQVEYERAISHPLSSALPPIFHLTDIHHHDSNWQVVLLIDEEIRRSGARQGTVVDRLTEVLFMKFLHRYVQDNQHLSGFLAALHEPRVNSVLRLIHGSPEFSWTLDILSDKVGMSRASLQRHFKSALNISPMAYLGQWRMAKAYHLLKHSNLSLEEIADAIGFSDARTLSRAFQKHYGATPSALRRRQQD